MSQRLAADFYETTKMSLGRVKTGLMYEDRAQVSRCIKCFWMFFPMNQFQSRKFFSPEIFFILVTSFSLDGKRRIVDGLSLIRFKLIQCVQIEMNVIGRALDR